MDRDIDTLRLLGRLEGASYLLLLGVAMPLKYLMGMAAATKWVGWPHGVLFIMYVGLVLRFAGKHGLSLKVIAGLLVGSLLPFGPFVAERFLPAREV